MQSSDRKSALLRASLQSIADQDLQTIRQAIGANIRQLREQRGWSHARLAEETNIAADHLAAIEAGEPGRADFDSLVKIRLCLDVTYPDIFGGIG